VKFRDDIDPATTWVVSDTHFGHENIVGFCHRPLDHEQVMIAEWRAQVPDDATVLHLGDLVYKENARFRHLTSNELTGKRKLLIMGNHDHQRPGFYKQCGFSIVRPFAIPYGGGVSCPNCQGSGLTVDAMGTSAGRCPRCDGIGTMTPKWTVSFSHYAWSTESALSYEDNGQDPRHVRVHGHIHNNGYSRDKFVPFLRNHINLSVEQTKYRPVNLKLLLDAALLGEYPATTQAQHDEAAARKAGDR
jgi:calcineurin-like phosphoesterase family protein